MLGVVFNGYYVGEIRKIGTIIDQCTTFFLQFKLCYHVSK